MSPVGVSSRPEDFNSLMSGLEERVFGRLPDATWIYPGHGDDSTLGAERPHLAEWRARGWEGTRARQATSLGSAWGGRPRIAVGGSLRFVTLSNRILTNGYRSTQGAVLSLCTAGYLRGHGAAGAQPDQKQRGCMKRIIARAAVTSVILLGLGAGVSQASTVPKGSHKGIDAEGRPSLERLQSRINVTGARAVALAAAEVPASIAVFDLLHLDGHDLRDLPCGCASGCSATCSPRVPRSASPTTSRTRARRSSPRSASAGSRGWSPSAATPLRRDRPRPPG